MEGSSYNGHFIVDYVNFQDEVEAFQTEKNPITKENHKGIFGCVTSEHGMFYDQGADGILGVGLSTNSTFPPDIIEVERSQGRIVESKFALCFGHNGGYMTLGGYNTSKHLPEAKEEVFKFYPDQGQYRIILNSVNVDGSQLDISKTELNSGQGVFIDSGTTVIYGPTQFIK